MGLFLFSLFLSLSFIIYTPFTSFSFLEIGIEDSVEHLCEAGTYMHPIYLFFFLTYHNRFGWSSCNRSILDFEWGVCYFRWCITYQSYFSFSSTSQTSCNEVFFSFSLFLFIFLFFFFTLFFFFFFLRFYTPTKITIPSLMSVPYTHSYATFFCFLSHMNPIVSSHIYMCILIVSVLLLCSLPWLSNAIHLTCVIWCVFGSFSLLPLFFPFITTGPFIDFSLSHCVCLCMCICRGAPEVFEQRTAKEIFSQCDYLVEILREADVRLNNLPLSPTIQLWKVNTHLSVFIDLCCEEREREREREREMLAYYLSL